MYDVLIVGGGPAGAFCGYLLEKKGYHCAILEKDIQKTEKTCGGLLPYKTIRLLQKNGISLENLKKKGAIIRRYHSVYGEDDQIFTYQHDKHGLGLKRVLLDETLLEYAQSVGVDVCRGAKVAQVQYRKDCVEACDIKGRLLIDAAGVNGIRGKIDPRDAGMTFGISMQVSGKSKLPEQDVFFFYPEAEKKDYYWAIPIGPGEWNVGMWFQHPDASMPKTFAHAIQQLQERFFFDWEVLRTRHGAFCGNAPLPDRLPCPHIAIGDAAGTCCFDSGEGIYQALHSAQMCITQVQKVLG